MATSGTYTFNPKVAECFDEAFERAGMDPAKVEVRHIVSAKRSLNLLLRSELAADQVNLWTVAEYTSTPVADANSLSLPTGAIDVLEATTRDSSGIEVPMEPISRSDWRAIAEKTQTGRPSQYWVDRSLGAKTLHFWQAMPATSYTLVMNVLYSIEDGGDLTNEAAVPDLWHDVICAGLAKRIAEKFNPERADRLEMKFAQAHKLAKGSNRERASMVITPDYGGRGGRWNW